MRERRRTRTGGKGGRAWFGLTVPLLILAMLAVGGCGGGGGGGGNDPTPQPTPSQVMEIEVESFGPAPWSGQQWQTRGGRPAGEIHPLLPLEFEVVLNANRSFLSMEDQVWVAVYLVEDPEAAKAARPFATPEEEPTDDPLYVGFHPFDLAAGKQTVTFRMHPETGIRPGRYKGFRAEFFTPGEDAELAGETQFEWLGDLTVLDMNTLPPIDKAWSELTVQADAPIPAGTAGFDFGTDAPVDPASGFSRLFGSDTPYSRSGQGGAVTGHYVELSASLEILALSGTVGAIVMTEDNGLGFWNPETGGFEKTFRWEERYISEVRDDAPVYASGFPRGTNGTALVVGVAGSAPPSVKVSDIKLSFVAYNSGGELMTGSVSALSDETLRPRRAVAAAGPRLSAAEDEETDYPFVLPENPMRVDLPVEAKNLRLDFSNNAYTWSEELKDTDLWRRPMGKRVDYVGSGKRTLYGSMEGQKDKFAARAYALFEEYTGLVHRLPAPGRVSIHDLSSICGTRTGAGVDIWIVNKKFTIFGAGAEFRNDLTAKTASVRNADGTYSLVTDPVEIDNYAKFSGMESEFNAEVTALGTTLLALPLYCSNAQPYDPKYSSLRLFEHANEVAMSVRFFIVDVRSGARFTFYVDLRLTNQFQNVTNGVEGTGTIALVPGVKVHGFAEGGVNLVLASVYLGLRLLFVELAVVPEYVMEGRITWQNGTDMPSATSAWSSYPRLGVEISTLDGEIYVRGKVFGLIESEEVFFKWKGFKWNLELWKGDPSDRPALTLPLRRFDA